MINAGIYHSRTPGVDRTPGAEMVSTQHIVVPMQIIPFTNPLDL